MEDLPDGEEGDPRTGSRLFNPHSTLNSFSPLLLLAAGIFPGFILIIALLVVALVCSALRACLSAYAALETPWRKKIHQKTPDRHGRFALLLIQHFCMLLAFILAANTFIAELTDLETARYCFLALVAIWLVADAISRWYASKYAADLPERFLSLVIPVLDVLSPIGRIFLRIATTLRIYRKDKHQPVTTLPDSAESDTLEEKELLLGVAAMGKTTAREAMVSKSGMRAFSNELDFHELMDLVNKFGYSRVPVYRHNLDDIEGILYIKDLLPYVRQDENYNWQKLIRKPYLIPETKRLDSLLEEFQERRVHMAIVIDEYGTTRGLITLEDIIEEIFGDINDEHDDEDESNFVQLDAHNFVFEGQALLNDVIRALELESDYFSELRTESETLAGLILELFTRVPRIGEETVCKDLTFKILSANKRQVKKIRVTLPG